MSLNSDEVQRAYLIMAGRAIGEGQAETMARLLWSREELLAALIHEDRVLDPWPDLAALIRELAINSYVKRPSVRTEQSDIVSRERSYREIAETIERIITSESERRDMTDRVHSALQRHVLAWDDVDTHPGYQWCVGHEPET